MHWHCLSIALGLMVRHNLPPAEQAWLSHSFTTTAIDLPIIFFTGNPSAGEHRAHHSILFYFLTILFYWVIFWINTTLCNDEITFIVNRSLIFQQLISLLPLSEVAVLLPNAPQRWSSYLKPFRPCEWKPPLWHLIFNYHQSVLTPPCWYQCRQSWAEHRGTAALESVWVSYSE